jgi:hypothetical protein
MLRTMKRHTPFVVLMSGVLAALALDLPKLAAGLLVLYVVLDLALDLALERYRNRTRGRF